MFQDTSRPVLCSVRSSSELYCKTPEVGYNSNYPSHLYIHLGVGISDVVHGNTTFRMPFSIFPDPTVTEWELNGDGEAVQDFKIYDGQKYIRIEVT